MDEISYEQFGANFVAHVVTPERVAATIQRLSGDEVAEGPLPAGPGGAATVTVSGRIDPIRPRVVLNRERLAFEAVIPIDLELEVKLALTSHRYSGRVEVPLHLEVRAVEPVMLMIDVDPVRPEDVRVDLKAGGMGARFLQRVGDVDEEVKRAVADMVNARMATPEAREAREYDILRYVEDSL